MKIEPIIYETTRSLFNIEDKLNIASIFLFCWKLGSITFSKLLYTENHKKFIENLNNEFSAYAIDLTLRLEDKNVRESFLLTVEKVKEKYDSNGYLKALYNKDEYAIVINEIVNSKKIIYEI